MAALLVRHIIAAAAVVATAADAWSARGGGAQRSYAGGTHADPARALNGTPSWTSDSDNFPVAGMVPLVTSYGVVVFWSYTKPISSGTLSLTALSLAARTVLWSTPTAWSVTYDNSAFALTAAGAVIASRCSNGALVAFSMRDGDVQWNVSSVSEYRACGDSAVSADDSTIFFVGRTVNPFAGPLRAVVAFSTVAGATRWTSAPLNATTIPSLTADGGIVVGGPGVLTKLRPNDGSVAWTVATPAGTPMPAVVVFGDTLFLHVRQRPAGLPPVVLAVAAATGAVVWSQVTGQVLTGATSLMLAPRAGLAAVPALIVLTTGPTVAWAAADGTPLWTSPVFPDCYSGATSTPVSGSASATVFIVCSNGGANDDGGLVAVDAATGRAQWRVATSRVLLGAPAVADDGTVVQAIATDGRNWGLMVLAPEPRPTPTATPWPTAVGPDTASWGTHRGNAGRTGSDTSGAYPVATTDGRAAWTLALPPGDGTAAPDDGSAASPVVSPAGDCVVFVGDDGLLHAVDTRTGVQRWAARPCPDGSPVAVRRGADVAAAFDAAGNVVAVCNDEPAGGAAIRALVTRNGSTGVQLQVVPLAPPAGDTGAPSAAPLLGGIGLTYVATGTCVAAVSRQTAGTAWSSCAPYGQAPRASAPTWSAVGWTAADPRPSILLLFTTTVGNAASMVLKMYADGGEDLPVMWAFASRFRGVDSPAVHPSTGDVFVATDGGLEVISAGGAPQWSWAHALPKVAGGGWGAVLGAPGSPASGLVFLGGFSGPGAPAVTALSVGRAYSVWEWPAPLGADFIGPPSLGADGLLVLAYRVGASSGPSASAAGGYVTALSAVSGTVVWVSSAPRGASAFAAPAVGRDGTVFFALRALAGGRNSSSVLALRAATVSPVPSWSVPPSPSTTQSATPSTASTRRSGGGGGTPMSAAVIAGIAIGAALLVACVAVGAIARYRYTRRISGVTVAASRGDGYLVIGDGDNGGVGSDGDDAPSPLLCRPPTFLPPSRGRVLRQAVPVPAPAVTSGAVGHAEAPPPSPPHRSSPSPSDDSVRATGTLLPSAPPPDVAGLAATARGGVASSHAGSASPRRVAVGHDGVVDSESADLDRSAVHGRGAVHLDGVRTSRSATRTHRQLLRAAPDVRGARKLDDDDCANDPN